MKKLDERDVIANCEYYALTVPRMAAALFKRTGKTMAPPKMVGSNGKALDLLERHDLWTDHFHALSRELYAAESLPEADLDRVAQLIDQNGALQARVLDLTGKLASKESDLAELKEQTKDARSAIEKGIAEGVALEVVKHGIRPTAITFPRPAAAPASCPGTPPPVGTRQAAILGADGRIRNSDGTTNWTAMQEMSGQTPSPIHHTI
jgi:hypothetical protein